MTFPICQDNYKLEWISETKPTQRNHCLSTTDYKQTTQKAFKFLFFSLLSLISVGNGPQCFTKE